MSQAQAKRDLDTVINEVHSLLDSINPNSSVQARVRQVIGNAQQKVADMAGEAKYKTKAAAKATDTYVHERPWQAVGVGAAVGLLIGFLVARR